MGHHITGIVGTPAVLARARDFGVKEAMIPLDATLAWIPLSDTTLEALTETSGLPKSDWKEPFTHFGRVLPALLTELSRDGPIAFIQTSYFGGMGDQYATAYDAGVRVVVAGTVNDALRVLGVVATKGQDEWDTVGLTKHRYMPDD